MSFLVLFDVNISLKFTKRVPALLTIRMSLFTFFCPVNGGISCINSSLSVNIFRHSAMLYPGAICRLNTPLRLAFTARPDVAACACMRSSLASWNKLFTSDNSVLFSLSRLVSQRFVTIGCLYGLSSTLVSRQTIKQAVWDTFSSTVE